MVSAYNICKGKPKGIRTQYQQIKRYSKNNSMDEIEPRYLFMRDFVKQCGKWVKNGKQRFIIMDGNDHAVDGELTQILSVEGIDLEELSHKFWGDAPPDSHVNGNGPIVAGYKSRGLEVTQVIRLPYSESVGDHRS